jgi:hypothetical protein
VVVVVRQMRPVAVGHCSVAQLAPAIGTVWQVPQT